MKKVHRVINFNPEVWLKPYIDANRELRRNTKYDIEKYFFNLMSNGVAGETIGNVEKTQRYQACNKQNQTELFSVRAKLSYNKIFLIIGNRNEKNMYTHE